MPFFARPDGIETTGHRLIVLKGVVKTQPSDTLDTGLPLILILSFD